MNERKPQAMNNYGKLHAFLKNGKLRGRVLKEDCPSRRILLHLTSRWGGLVLVALYPGTKRFNVLHREIEGISERMLTQALQRLEGDGMVLRRAFDTVPPHVEYSLTHFGRQAAERFNTLVEWLEENLEDILVASGRNEQSARPKRDL